jgi:hypothetical protein
MNKFDDIIGSKPSSRGGDEKTRHPCKYYETSATTNDCDLDTSTQTMIQLTPDIFNQSPRLFFDDTVEQQAFQLRKRRKNEAA